MTFVYRSILASVFLAVSAVSASADEAISLKVGYMLLSPSGDMAAEVNGIGSTVDLESDLGLDDSSNIIAEAAFSLGDVKVTLGYMPLSFEGDSILSRTIIFDGEVYSAGSRVMSNLDVDILDAGLTWYFINVDDVPTRVQLGVELSAKITGVDASIDDSTTGLTESVSETLPIPTIGLRGRVAFSDFVGVAGRIGYIGYSDNRFLDADVQVEITPIPLVGLFAGYRYLDLEIDESDIYVDAQFSGFYGGALVRF